MLDIDRLFHVAAGIHRAVPTLVPEPVRVGHWVMLGASKPRLTHHAHFDRIVIRIGRSLTPGEEAYLRTMIAEHPRLLVHVAEDLPDAVRVLRWWCARSRSKTEGVQP